MLHHRGILVLADDLSGAAECAAELVASAGPVPVHLGPVRQAGPGLTVAAALAVPPGGATVLDLDSRYCGPDEARRRVSDALALAGGGLLLVKKIDSLLRGNVAEEVGALLAAAERVVLTPALPALGRTVTDGVPHLDGRPLARTTAWSAETRPAPERVRDVLHALPVHELPLSVVRGDDLAGAIRPLRGVVVCDAVTDEDLDRVHGAAATLGGTVLAGSAALVAAAARAAAGHGPRPVALPGTSGASGASEAPTRRTAPRLLLVAGSADERSRAQVDYAHLHGVPVSRIDPHALLAGDPHDALVRRIAGGTAPMVLTIDDVPVAPEVDRGLLARLVAEIVARAVALGAEAPDLFLSGGATARAVLDRLGSTSLTVTGVVAPGVVRSTGPAGVTVLTRPGSYGPADSLVQIIAASGSRSVRALEEEKNA
ncbi:MAG TPA: four-carbon acid sugar kinase family protein [Cellulomonas sp.]